MRTCTKCGDEKDEKADFYTDSRRGKPLSRCKICTNEDNAARAAANPEKHNARSRAWREAHPGRASEIARAWQLRHPEQFKQIVQKRRFNIDFNAMWEAQQGLCACCNKPMLRKGREPTSACVDHDRSCCGGKKSCGKCVRGVIHRNCNLVLGYAKDDPHVLRSAIEYLERARSAQELNTPLVEPVL